MVLPKTIRTMDRLNFSTQLGPFEVVCLWNPTDLVLFDSWNRMAPIILFHLTARNWLIGGRGYFAFDVMLASCIVRTVKGGAL